MSDAPPDTALVLFSGGQDSATCLAWALGRYRRVETVGFDYGQRHEVELAARERLRDALSKWPGFGGRLGPDHRLSVPTFREIGETAMTHDLPIEQRPDGLPNTFVPGRNVAFLTFAAALAVKRGITSVVGGMCETDAAGYPDCRSATMRAMEEALTLGMGRKIVIETPLVALSKAQTWALAEREGGQRLVSLIVEDSHTCYKGDREHRHPWGYGCGECPACIERRKGWEGYRGYPVTP